MRNKIAPCEAEGGPDLQAGSQELHNVAIVARSQDEDLATEGFRIARLMIQRDLVCEDLDRHSLHPVAHCLVHLCTQFREVTLLAHITLIRNQHTLCSLHKASIHSHWRSKELSMTHLYRQQNRSAS